MFSYLGKKLKEILRSSAFSNGLVDTDLLFKSGYGHWVSLICQLCFFATFFYVTVTNTQNLMAAKYLSPVDQKNSGAICSVDPIEITSTFTMDQYGYWDVEKNFNFSQGIYNLDLKNVKFQNGQKSFQSQIVSFTDSFKLMSDKSHERDYAWNMVFAASYSETSFENEGLSQFRINADARIMYRATGEEGTDGSGIVYANGVCEIDGAKYIYDDIAGSFAMEVSVEGYSWDICDGIFSGVTDLKQTIEFDAASISTALAVNMGITSLKSLSKLYVDFDDDFFGVNYDDVSNYYNYFDVYVDSYYAPMQPIFCLKVDLWLSHGNGTESEWDSAKDHLCLVRFGTSFALPLTNHMGEARVLNETEMESLDDQWWCNSYSFYSQCTTQSAHSDCFLKNVFVSLLFFPADNLYGYTGYDTAFRFMIDLMLDARLSNPEHPDLALMELTYPVMKNSYLALYQASGDDSRCDNTSRVVIHDTFENFCAGECALLTFVSSGELGGAIALNSGSYPYQNLAFNNTLYNAEVLHDLQQSPVQLTEKYQVCYDSFQTAFTTALSNAFASAGLYTSLLLVGILFVIKHTHNYMNPTSKLYSPDKIEADIRRFTVKALILASLEKRTDAEEELFRSLLSNIMSSESSEGATYVLEMKSSQIGVEKSYVLLPEVSDTRSAKIMPAESVVVA